MGCYIATPVDGEDLSTAAASEALCSFNSSLTRRKLTATCDRLQAWAEVAQEIERQQAQDADVAARAILGKSLSAPDRVAENGCYDAEQAVTAIRTTLP